jgi:TetR/AcrR family transcriptional repressor of nem operon
LLALIDDRSYINAMARPRRSDHLREELLEKGIEVLIAQGYHGTGLKQIVDEVKVPKGSFYNYFESKEKYVSEILERYNLKLLGQLDQYLEHTKDDPVTIIRNIYCAAIKELEKSGQRGCLIGNLAAEVGNICKECQPVMRHAVQAWKDRITKVIAQAQSQDLVRDDLSPDALSDILWNAWHGGLLRMKIEGNTAQLKQTLDVLLDSLFKGDPN